MKTPTQMTNQELCAVVEALQAYLENENRHTERAVLVEFVKRFEALEFRGAELRNEVNDLRVENANTQLAAFYGAYLNEEVRAYRQHNEGMLPTDAEMRDLMQDAAEAAARLRAHL